MGEDSRDDKLGEHTEGSGYESLEAHDLDTANQEPEP